MNKRLEEMDIMRGFSIISVIVIHITSVAIDSAQNNFTGAVLLLLNQVSRFAVPVFLMLSGWGLTISKKYEMRYFDFLKSQLSKIILYYLFWNIIYYFMVSDLYNFSEMIKGVAFGTTYYHLYYVPLLIFFYIIYPMIYKISQSNLILFIVLIVTIFSQLADFITGKEVFNSGSNIFNWLFFFVFGIWFAADSHDKIIKLKNHVFLLLIIFLSSITIVFVESYSTLDELGKALSTTSMRPSVILLSVTFFALVISVNWSNCSLKKMIVKIANVSYGIYLSHALILVIFNIVWNKLGFSSGSIIFMITAFLFVTAISLVIAKLMDVIENSVKNYKYRGKVTEE